MNGPTGDGGFEIEFEAEVRAELGLVASSDAEEVAGLPASEGLFDPADAGREQLGLRNLLGAARELEADDLRDETP